MRIAHFTDVHVTRRPADFPLRDLMSKRGVGWLNLLVFRRYKRFHHVSDIIRAFNDDVLSQQPDLILFTGDLTAVAYRNEFERAAELFSPLLGRQDVTGIPGNHDVYTRKARGREIFAEHFSSWIQNDRADLVDRGLEGPRVRLLGDELAVIALPSVRPARLNDSSGLVGEARLSELERLLEDEDLQRRRVILALHYGLMLRDGRPDKASHGLRDADAVLRLARDYGVELVVHGHLHERFVIPAGDVAPISIANAGSLTDARHAQSYHLYEIREDGIEVGVRRYNRAEGRFEAWDSAPGAGLLPRENVHSKLFGRLRR